MEYYIHPEKPMIKERYNYSETVKINYYMTVLYILMHSLTPYLLLCPSYPVLPLCLPLNPFPTLFYFVLFCDTVSLTRPFCVWNSILAPGELANR